MYLYHVTSQPSMTPLMFSVRKLCARRLMPFMTTWKEFFYCCTIMSLLVNLVGLTTTVNVSSMHVLKRYTQWWPQQLLELIDKLRDVVQSQFVEADRALCGQGDFQLAPSAACHQVTLEYLSTRSAKQRETMASSCFCLQPTVPSMMLPDKQFTVPIAPAAGQKPHHQNGKWA